MISEFSLENFKAFADAQSIPIKPITLIYGENSSGKSSIIQALLMLKQTIEEKHHKDNKLLSRGGLVDLGSYREFVNSHNDSKEVLLDFFFKESETSKTSIKEMFLNDIQDRRRISDFDEIPENSIFIEDREVESGIKLFISKQAKTGGAFVRKIEVYFSSREPFVTYELLSQDESSTFTLKEINPKHHLLRELWKDKQEQLSELVFNEIKSALKRLYSTHIDNKAEVLERLQMLHNEASQALEKLENDLAMAKEIEKTIEHQIQALKSHTDNLEEKIKEAERDEAVLIESGANADTILSLQQELEDVKKQISDKELELSGTRKIISASETIDTANSDNQTQAIEDEIEELDALIKFWRNSQETSFEKYLNNLKRALNNSFKLVLENFSISFDNNSSKSLESYYFFRVYERFSASITLVESITSTCCSILEEMLESIDYLGPLREAPRRFYEAKQSTGSEVDKYGYSAIEQLYYGDSELKDTINDYFERFGIRYSIDAKSFQSYEAREFDLESLYAVRLIDGDTGIDVNISNVGFGISQVLPIIVKSLTSVNKLLLIEQPELHIHPKLQTELGELFVNCIESPRNNLFIIETHSEHLLLRLQTLISKGRIREDDVTIIYVDRKDKIAKCFPLRLDFEGDLIDDWPDDFFDERHKEIFSR